MSVIPAELHVKVQARVEECYAIAEKQWPGKKFVRPTWDYSTRGRVAGYARRSDNSMRFNRVLLLENREEFIERTVAHEVAHLVADEVYGHWITAHGREWKSVMVDFGLEPSRCHTYDTTNSRVRKTARHEYECNGCGGKMVIGPKRHIRQQTTGGTYFMRGCKNHGGYTYLGLEGAALPEAKIAAQNPAERQATVRDQAVANTYGSKKDFCWALYRKHHGVSRKAMIELFVKTAGCTPKGAATYYATCKKAYGR